MIFVNRRINYTVPIGNPVPHSHRVLGSMKSFTKSIESRTQRPTPKQTLKLADTL